MKRLNRPLEVKEIGDDGTFSGYASVFGELDHHRDIVLPGAFKDSLASYEKKGRPVPMLWQHDPKQPIGIYTEIKEDNNGLYIKGEINMKVSRGAECHALMEQKALSGLSIGYDTVKESFNHQTKSRNLHLVDLWEISPVTFPSGDSARVLDVKSIEQFSTLAEFEQALRDVGMTQSEAKTFVSRVKAVSDQRDVDPAQLEQLRQLIQSL